MRDDENLLWLILGGLALAALTGGGVVIYNQTRGLRNNNPGNIRRSPSVTWQGQAPAQTDPDFVQFVNMQSGVRALALVLSTYMNNYGLNTVRGIISRYAPSSENNTAAYIADVAGRLGVDPDQALDASAIPALVDAIAHHENAPFWELVPRETLTAGLQLANIAYV